MSKNLFQNLVNTTKIKVKEVQKWATKNPMLASLAVIGSVMAVVLVTLPFILSFGGKSQAGITVNPVCGTDCNSSEPEPPCGGDCNSSTPEPPCGGNCNSSEPTPPSSEPISSEPREVCDYNSGILANSPDCKPCPYNPNLWIKDARCVAPVTPCKYNSALPSTSIDCQPCSYNPNIWYKDANCKAPVQPCQWNPAIPANDSQCFEPCQWNPNIPKTDSNCKEPVAPCTYNPSIPATDPNCKEPQPNVEITKACSKSFDGPYAQSCGVFSPGQEVFYKINLKNTGTGPAVNLRVYDMYDATKLTNIHNSSLWYDYTLPYMIFGPVDISVDQTYTITYAANLSNNFPANVASGVFNYAHAKYNGTSTYNADAGLNVFYQIQMCQYNPNIPAADPNCKPPVSSSSSSTSVSSSSSSIPACTYNPNIPANDPNCFEPCQYDSSIPKTDANCVPPVEPCLYNPNIPANDPECYEPCPYDVSIPKTDANCTEQTSSSSSTSQSSSSTESYTSSSSSTTTTTEPPIVRTGGKEVALITILATIAGAAVYYVTQNQKLARDFGGKRSKEIK